MGVKTFYTSHDLILALTHLTQDICGKCFKIGSYIKYSEAL